MTNNPSLEANIAAAKTAVYEMLKSWNTWKSARDEKTKSACIAAYAAAYTNCKVFIENYLKHLYPNERKVPSRVMQDVRNLVGDMDVIEKTNEQRLHRAIHDIDQLSRDAA